MVLVEAGDFLACTLSTESTGHFSNRTLVRCPGTRCDTVGCICIVCRIQSNQAREGSILEQFNGCFPTTLLLDCLWCLGQLFTGNASAVQLRAARQFLPNILD